MSACTICGRESSTCPGHLNERSNEIAWLREDRDQARAEAMALRKLVADLFMNGANSTEITDKGAMNELEERVEKALAMPSAEHLRAFAYDAWEEGWNASHVATCDPFSSLTFKDQAWQQSAIRASLGKEGA